MESPPSRSILAEITAGLSSGNDLHELLGRFLHDIVRIAGAQAGAVRVLDESDRRMHLVGEVGLPGGVLDAERSVEPDCGVCGAAMLGHRPLWADDLSRCAHRSAGRFFGAGCERMLAVPLQHRGRVLGVYNLFYDAGAQPPAGVDSLLESIGALLGLALAHAQLEREHVQAAVLHERQMMAADVHDSVAQSLAFVKMRLPLLHDAILGRDADAAMRWYDDIRGTVSEAHTGLRQLLAEMRTRVDPEGLMHALRALTGDFESRTGIALTLDDRAGTLALGAERQTQAYHVVQEALANVVRHAMAAHVTLAAEVHDGIVRLRVEDDGTGVGAEAGAGGTLGAHYGIDIMKARARRLGGTLELRPRPGGGTCVELVFPLQEPDPARRRAAPCGGA